MKLNIINTANKVTGKIDLPQQFEEEVRPDLVQRAVVVIQSNKRQQYGSRPMAGLRHSTQISKRRRDYKGCYGIGISRVPRKIMSRKGTRMNWTGAKSPGCVGGRRAHPPKAEKIWAKKINITERRKAIRSALAATMLRQLVEQRGHKIPKEYPFIIDNEFEKITKTKALITALKNIGMNEEIERTAQRKLRAGRGKSRGRKYITRKGPLIVVGDDCKLMNIQSLPGIDITRVDRLNAEILAPGTHIARAALFTSSAIEKLKNELLFTKNPIIKNQNPINQNPIIKNKKTKK